MSGAAERGGPAERRPGPCSGEDPAPGSRDGTGGATTARAVGTTGAPATSETASGASGAVEATGAAEATGAVEPGPPGAAGTTAAHIPATVLVVDDTETNRYILGSWLRRDGHAVLEAATGRHGLDMAAAATRDGGIDVAIVDVRLPDMTGFEVCERLKSDPATAFVPVVHVSAAAISVGDRAHGLYRGADAYLTEPVEPEVLLATLQAALRYSKARRQAEHTARLLTDLVQATMVINAATAVEELGAAMAAGAARITGGPASSYVSGPDGRIRRTLVHGPGGSPVSLSTSSRTPEALAEFTLGDRVGATAARIPAGEWAGRMPGGASATDVHLVTCRTKGTRPLTGIAVPAEAAAGTEEAGVLLQLAQTGALAAEALRSYAEEHALALTLQRSFLPTEPAATDDVEMAVRYLPASDQAEIGGDFYEAVMLDDRLLVAIGDVAGHSLHAATVMGELRHALRAFAGEGHPPVRVLDLLTAMMQRYHPYETATVCLLLLDPATGEAEIANAGHLPPLVLTPDGTATYLDAHGPLLGLELPRPPATFTTLPPGALLVLYTDGLIERRDSDIDTGMAALRAQALACPPGTGPEALADHLLTTLGGDTSDDTALLILRRTGPR